MPKTMSRGGARQGAGRPARVDKMVTVSFRLPPEAAAIYKALKAEGYDIRPEIIDLLTKKR